MDARIKAAGGAIGTHHQLQLGGQLVIRFGRSYGIEIVRAGFLEASHLMFRGSIGDEGRGPRGVDDPLRCKVIGIGVASALAGDDTDPAAGGNPLRS